MIALRLALSLLSALLLGGCAALTSISDATTPLQAYGLRAPAEAPGVRGSLSRDLVIETPNAGGALDTDRILIRPDPFQAAYLPQARWTDTAPVMLQGLMLRAFEDAGALRYVGRRPVGGTADYLLLSELTDFQAEIAPDGETVTTRLRLTARLVREADATILGSRTIETTAPAASTAVEDVVAGLDAATRAALRDLTTWALRRMGLSVPE
jgi:cholesterol transport system auxiliary component